MSLGLKNAEQHSSQSWYEALQELKYGLKNLLLIPYSKDNFEAAVHKLHSLEKQIQDLHANVGAWLSDIHEESSPLESAALIGVFRRDFQEINDLYGQLKSTLTGEPIDEHLFCMCQYSLPHDSQWPLSPHMLPVQDIRLSQPSKVRSAKSSLLIFTCAGGQGHISATKAMAQNASGKYHVLVANTLEETLAPIDLIKKLTLNFSQEKLYNYLLKNERFKFLKLMTSSAPLYFRLQQRRFEELIRLEVLKQSPDMLISCIPYFNSMFLNIAKEFQLPLLIVTTDLDCTTFVSGMSESTCDLHYPHYRFAIPYNTPDVYQIVNTVIPAERIVISGFPIRRSFNKVHTPADYGHYRERYGIDPKAKIVLVMMGGNAGSATENYARILADITDEEFFLSENESLHVLCLCGNLKVFEDQQMYEAINGLKTKCSRVRIQGISATPEIASLMSIADVLITKPGGCTVNEAIAKKLPMIFHAPFALMDWEVFNMRFCIQRNFGSRFKLYAPLGLLTDGELKKNKRRLLPLLKEGIKRREKEISKMGFEKKDFSVEFEEIVDGLLQSAAASA